ncbi:MAG: PIN domain-containing protein [Candidatus Rokubacteria bacterium]|nr:PIN domain-containing protein [Candidatus Rokubacteria bacterium]
MILVDTGPFVALFDPKDASHRRCREVLKTFQEPLVTTVPVLTEAFHMLSPNSTGADRLRDFIARGGATVWTFDAASLQRAFALMEEYADHPMDLADASLIVAAEALATAAEALATPRVFTIDRQGFQTYRIRRGHRSVKVEILG